MICRTPDWLVFVFTLSGARIAAVFANKAEPKILCTIIKFKKMQNSQIYISQYAYIKEKRQFISYINLK